MSTTELDASDKWMSRRLLTIHSPFSLKKNVETSSSKFLLFVFLFTLSPKKRFSFFKKLLHFFIFSSHGENIFLFFKMKSHMIEPDVRKGD